MKTTVNVKIHMAASGLWVVTLGYMYCVGTFATRERAERCAREWS